MVLKWKKVARILISFNLSVTFYFTVLICYHLYLRARNSEQCSLKISLQINSITSLQMVCFSRDTILQYLELHLQVKNCSADFIIVLKTAVSFCIFQPTDKSALMQQSLFMNAVVCSVVDQKTDRIRSLCIPICHRRNRSTVLISSQKLMFSSIFRYNQLINCFNYVQSFWFWSKIEHNIYFHVVTNYM